jgi:hypothetical protein
MRTRGERNFFAKMEANDRKHLAAMVFLACRAERWGTKFTVPVMHGRKSDTLVMRAISLVVTPQMVRIGI